MTSTLALTAIHAKYSLIETFRTPIAIIGSAVFPTLAFLFFVVPNRAVAQNPEYATQAVISMCVFAVMVGALFSFGLGVAEKREKPWHPYLRTLPAPGVVRVFAEVLSTGLISFVSILPVVAVGGFLTAAEAPWWRILLGLVALALAGLPFMFLGIAIGYSMPMKAAIAVIQIVMFAFAFAGGLFLPPVMFADWLNTLSQFFPSRQARELVIGAVQGGPIEWWVWVGILLWTLGALALALILFRRDEGRRYR